MCSEARIEKGRVFCPECGALNMVLHGDEYLKNLKMRCRKSKANNEHFFTVNFGEIPQEVIEVGGQNLVLKFSFEAAEQKELISGLFKSITNIGAIPVDTKKLCNDAFYAGLLEENPLSKVESSEILEKYIKLKNTNYGDMFAGIKKLMEKSGFYKIAGLEELQKRKEKEID